MNLYVQPRSRETKIPLIYSVIIGEKKVLTLKVIQIPKEVPKVFQPSGYHCNFQSNVPSLPQFEMKYKIGFTKETLANSKKIADD